MKKITQFILFNILFISSLTGQNVLYNGDFESGGNGTNFLVDGAGYTLVTTPTGNTSAGNYAFVSNPLPLNTSSFISSFDHTTGNATGKMMVVDGNNNNTQPRFWKAGSNGQGICGMATVSGQYFFSYYIKSVANTVTAVDPTTRADIRVAFTGVINVTLVQGSAIAPLPSTVAPNFGWEKVTYSFTAINPCVTIEMWNNNTNFVGNDFAIDDLTLSLASVPGSSFVNSGNTSCNAANDGFIVVNPANPPLTVYTLSGTSSQTNSTGVFINLAPGTYAINFTDPVLGVTNITAITITQPAIVPPLITSPNTVIGIGNSTTLTASGGNGTYLWTSSPTDPSLTAPTAANITVSPTVTTTYTCSSGAIIKNLIYNGDFEVLNHPFITNAQNYNQIANPSCFENTIGIVPNAQAWCPTLSNCNTRTSTGSMLVYNGANLATGSKIVWSQKVPVPAGTNLTFSFWLQSLGIPLNPSTVEVTINGVVVNTGTIPALDCTWAQRIINWNSGVATMADIRIIDKLQTIGYQNDYAIDDIMFTYTKNCTPNKTVIVSIAPNNPVIGGLNLAVSSTSPNVCEELQCADLTATYTDTKATTTYTVAQKPGGYAAYPFNGGTLLPSCNSTNTNCDDFWSTTIAIPFKFCFFGNTYTSFLIGTNGVVTFEQNILAPPNPQFADGYCQWSFNQTLPSTSLPLNSILGIYQDIHFQTRPPTSYTNYQVFGTYPNRAMVVSFFEIPQYANQLGNLQTYQIVMHEMTNVIEVNIQRRVPNNGWQGGVGVLGIQNLAGTVAVVPTGRNTGNWTALNESWVFTPNTNDVPPLENFHWEDAANPGVSLGSANPLNVCIDDETVPETYVAVVEYKKSCDITEVVRLTKSITIGVVTTLPVFPPKDICYVGVLPAIINIDQEATMLTPAQIAAGAFSLTYFTVQADAINGGGPSQILNPLAYNLTVVPQIIYVRVEDLLVTGCAKIYSFTIRNAPNGTFSYPASPYCNTLTSVAPTLSSLSPGGTYTSTPAGLNIVAATGVVNPSLSTVNSYIVTYSVTATTSCPAYSTTATIQIASCGCSVTANNTGPICIGNSATLNVVAPVAGGTYTWTNSLGYNSGPLASPSVSVTPATSGNIIYTLNVTSPSGNCTSSTTLVVNAIPLAPTFTTPSAYCVGVTASQLSATGTGLLWYSTLSGLPAGSTTAPTPTTTVAGTQNYYVTQTVNGCESTPRTLISVTVNAIPVAPTFTPPAAYCVGATATQLTATGTGLLWYSALTGGTGSSTAPTPTTTVAGTQNYYVTQTVNGCESSPRTLISVTIKALPSAPTFTPPAAYCVGATASQLSATGTGLLWYSTLSGLPAGSTTAPTPTTTVAGTQNYYVTQTVNGCESTPRTLISVTVNAIPLAPTFTPPAPYCVGVTASQLTATGTGLLWYSTLSGLPAGSTTAPTPTTTVAGTQNYYVTQTVNGCESTPRTLISVTVNAIPVAPTFTPPAPYCVGATATQLTATGTGLLWYSALTGGTGSSTAPTPTTTVAGTQNYYVTQTVNGCESSPRTLISVTIKALPSAPTFTPPAAYCVGATASQLSATGTGLLWYSTLSGLPAGSTTAPTPTTTVAGTQNYYVTQTVNGCESTPRTLISVTVNAIPLAPTFTPPAPYCVGVTASQLSATGTGLLWYSTLSGLPAGSTTAPTPTTTVAGTQNYYVTQTVNGCESTPRTLISVTVNAIPVAPTFTPPAAYCVGVTAAQLTATGTGLLWYSALTGGTGSSTAPTPTTTVAGTQNYYVTQTVNGCESSPRTLISVTIKALPSAPTFTPPAAYCVGATATQLSATGTGLLWYSTLSGLPAGSTTAPTPTTTVAGTQNYYVTQTVNGCESTPRTLISVTVNAIPLAPTFTPPAAYCVGATASQLSATGTGLLWYSTLSGLPAGSTTAPTPTTTVAGTQNYYVTQTVNGCESTPRTLISVTVNAIPVAPTFTPPAPYCVGATATQLTATGTGLLWYSALTGGTGSSTAPTPTTTVAGTQNYYVTQTVNGCESSPRTLISVTIKALPSAPTFTPPAAYCVGATASQLSATGTGLLWYSTLSGLPAGSTTAPTPTTTVAGTQNYYVTQTVNGCESTPRTLISITVNAIPLAPTFTPPAPYCVGVTASQLTATGTGLLWYSTLSGLPAGSTTAPTPTTTVAGTQNYYVTQTVNGCESTPRTLISVTVNAIPLAPTFTPPAAYCVGATAAQLTATGTGLLWYSALTGGTGSSTAPTPTTTVAGTQNYYVTQTVNGCESSPRTLISVTIKALPSAPTFTPPAAYCVGATATQLSATGTGLLWYSTLSGLPAGSTTAPTPTTTVAGTQNYYVTQTVNGCESTPRTLISVTVNAIPLAPTFTPPAPYCVGVTASQLTATGTGLLWYSTLSGLPAGSTTAPTPTTTVAGTQNYYVTQTVNGCESTPRTLISVTVNAIPVAPTFTPPAPYCVGATATQLTATGTGLLWYSALTGGTGSSTAPTPTTTVAGTQNYYVTQTVNGCESSPRTLISVTIKALPSAPTFTPPAAYCVGATASQLSATGTGLLWYSTLSGLPAGSTTAPTPTTTVAGTQNYYVTQTVNGCESTPRTLISVTVNAIPLAPTFTPPAPYCVGVTASQLTATGTGLLWYSTLSGLPAGSTTAPTPTTTVAGTQNYYVTQTVNGCESTPRTLISVTVNAIPVAPTFTPPAPYCVGATATQLTATGTGLLWYSALTGGTGSSTAPTPTTTVAGTQNYYVTQTVNGCESSPRTLISVTIKALPSAPTFTPPAAYCVGATASQLSATGTGLLWYSTLSGLPAGSTTAPTPTTTVAGTQNYYVTQTVNGCESTPRTLISVTVNAIPLAPTFTPPAAYCVGVTASQLTATGTSLLWYSALTGGTGSSTAPTPTTTVSGTQTFYVSQTVNNCESPRTFLTITVNPAPSLILTPGLPVEVCAPSTVDITAAAITTLSDPGQLTYWKDAQATIVLNNPAAISISDTYYIKLTSTNGCPTIKPIIVKINPLPVIILDQDGYVCVDINGVRVGGSSYQLTTGLSSTGYNFEWYDDTVAPATVAIVGETGANYTVIKPGKYRVVVKNSATGCTNFAIATVIGSVAPSSMVFVASSYFADEKVITVNVNPVGNYEYQINNGVFQDSNIFTGVNPGDNKIVVRDKYNCGQKEDTIRLLDFPKYFTPNGDNFNDYWNIFDLEKDNQLNAKIYIFDRYGKLLKQITPASQGWDGTFNSNDLPADDYWFTVEYEEQQITKTFKAHFSLKR